MSLLRVTSIPPPEVDRRDSSFGCRTMEALTGPPEVDASIAPAASLIQMPPPDVWARTRPKLPSMEIGPPLVDASTSPPAFLIAMGPPEVCTTALPWPPSSVMGPPDVRAFNSPFRSLTHIGPPSVCMSALNFPGTVTRYSTSRSQRPYSRHFQSWQMVWPPRIMGRKSINGTQPLWNAPATRIS